MTKIFSFPPFFPLSVSCQPPARFPPPPPRATFVLKKKFHYHCGNQSFLTTHQPSLSYDLTSCWTLWAVHQLKAPSPTPPRHRTTHTFTQFFTLMLSVFFSRSTLFPSLSLSLSLSLFSILTPALFIILWL